MQLLKAEEWVETNALQRPGSGYSCCLGLSWWTHRSYLSVKSWPFSSLFRKANQIPFRGITVTIPIVRSSNVKSATFYRIA